MKQVSGGNTKACPVCGAVAFEDASTCFGCMHSFEGGEVDAAGMPVEKKEALHASKCVQGAPEFLITFTPVVDASGALTWRCAVEA